MTPFLFALMLFQAKVIECNRHAPWKAADRIELLKIDEDDGDECFTIRNRHGSLGNMSDYQRRMSDRQRKMILLALIGALVFPGLFLIHDTWNSGG